MRVHSSQGTSRLILGVLLMAFMALALVAAACHSVGTGGPSAPNHPIGVLESVSGLNGTVRVTGWATDNWSGLGNGLVAPAGPRVPATVVAVLNGSWVPSAFTAAGVRPDVGAILDSNSVFARYRQPGNAYGFDFTHRATRPSNRVRGSGQLRLPQPDHDRRASRRTRSWSWNIRRSQLHRLRIDHRHLSARLRLVGLTSASAANAAAPPGRRRRRGAARSRPRQPVDRGWPRCRER